ncbi:MAG: ATP-dependent metallopeptidase FtsH/Yme1/Tma family protein [Candidatus Eremiobacterota bacterium]
MKFLLKFLNNKITICILLISIGVFLGYYIYHSYNDYTVINYEYFISLANKNIIKSVEIDKNRIVVITGGEKSKLKYYILPLSEKDKVLAFLKEKEKLINYPKESLLFVIPYLILFLVLSVIIMASRRGNIKETLFKEQKFRTTSSLMKVRMESITWTNLISGEPFKITTAYGDLSSSEQDQYLLLLIEAARSKDLEIKRNASFALREIGDRRSLLPLCNIMEEEDDPNIKMNIALALGIIGEEKSMDTLKKFIKDENPLVRCSIATAIGGIAAEESLELLRKMMNDDESWRVKRSAIMSLMKFREDSAFSAIVAAISDTEPAVRASAAIALGEMGIEEGIEPLETILSGDPEPSVRKEAILALQELGGEPIIKPLCRALSEDESKIVRKSALSALELIDNDMVTETLSNTLKNDKDPDIRLAAAETLAIKHKEALKIALDDKDDMVRAFVREELKSSEG